MCFIILYGPDFRLRTLSVAGQCWMKDRDEGRVMETSSLFPWGLQMLRFWVPGSPKSFPTISPGPGLRGRMGGSCGRQ